jgi:hypothetical protein
MNRAALALYYGNGGRTLAWVAPAGSGLWRIQWPDGRTSDVVNLTRAKDAAVALAERGPPARNRRRFHWQYERSKSPAEGAPVRLRGSAATSGWAGWPAAGGGGAP